MEGSLHKFPVDGPRKIIVARHGERVDFTFGDWTRFCFDETRKYQQCDLNMPETLPQRKGAPRSFYKDGPLTNIGVFQATLVGQALKANNTEVHHVFCSPALRCVQTCASILKGMGIDEVMPINIEPGLFEFLPWYKDEIPTWMTLDELTDAGFNISHNYDQITQVDELNNTNESCKEFYCRNFNVAKKIIKRTQGGTVLLVGHGATLDTCTRELVGGAPRAEREMLAMIKKIPYCSVAFAAQDTKGRWSLQKPPFLPATHSANNQFDWNVLSS
nr:protein UBASH3A homolog isoform X2 [Cherax quadricarinatus]